MTQLAKRRRGGQVGNVNAAKGKWMTDGLVRALAREDYKRFNAGIEHLARKFAKGERWALEMAFDRIQGRPMPALPEVEGDGTLVVSWVMQGAPAQVIEHAPSTIEHARQAEVIDHSEASAVPGPIPQIGDAGRGHAELARGEGVGGGGGTPAHTSGTPPRTLDVTPVPERSDGVSGD